MANEQTPGVDYHMVHSVVRVSGTRKVTVDEAVRPAKTTEEAEAAVELEATADPTFRFGLAFDGGWTKDVGVEIAFTDTLCMKSVGTTSKGRVGEAVKGTLKFVVSTLATVASIAAKGAAGTAASAPGAPGEEVSPDQVYAEERADASDQREKTKAAILALRAALIENDASLATLGPGDANKAARRSRQLQDALGRLEAQYSDMNARYDAWLASKRMVTTGEFEFVVPVKDLPKADDVDAHLSDPSEEVLKKCWAMYNDLHTVVAVREISGVKDDRDQDPTVDHKFEGVFYRKPRDVELSVYERVKQDDRDVLVITQRSRHFVVDDKCERRYIAFQKSSWGDRSVGVEFGELGAPTKVSTSATAVAAAVGQVLGDLPATVKDALDTGSAAADQLDKIRNAGLTRELARMQKEAEFLKQRIADDLSGADGAALRELEALRRKKELLALRKEVGALEAPPSSTPAPAPATGRTVVITIDGEPAD